ncbi:hypothetical protein Nit79A3_3520 [Nitrosomonas sp. Is79A3]|uniref:hypothetical protein n=1 Tax=Nitrosomonas sp. (strain Is79A3) TaxID=261292 RepID=UPI000215C7CB
MNNHQDSYTTMVANPLVPMTLRIGVAGHLDLPEVELQRLREEIEATYADIRRALQAISPVESKNIIAKMLYDNDIEPIMRIISSLAEGADRLCIEPDIMPPHAELACILPFPAKQYAQDFLPRENEATGKKSGTVAEFYSILQRFGYYTHKSRVHYNRKAQVIELDGDPNRRTQAYIDCSRLLVTHSDILIAVYDGDNSEDKGTAAAVQAAWLKGIPVIHISTLPMEERRIYRCDQSSNKKSQTYTAEILQDELSRALLFTDLLNDSNESNSAFKQEIFSRFKHYQADKHLCLIADESPDYDNAGPIKLKKEYKSFATQAFDTFKRMIARKEKVDDMQKRLFSETENHRGDTQNQEGLPEKKATPSQDRYYAAYLYADRLANYYSRSHRSTFVLIYLLGAAALTAAVFALAFKTSPVTWPMLVLVLIELALLLTISKLYQQDRHDQKYHKHWLEYRHLSEVLRPMHYLSLLGRTYSIEQPPHDNSKISSRTEIDHSTAGRTWQSIYTHTINRWAGFSVCQLSQSYQKHIRTFLTTTWVDGQINYHRKNAAMMSVSAQTLEKWNHGLFTTTILVVCFKLITVLIDLLHQQLVHQAIQTMIFPGEIAYPLALLVIVLPICATTTFAIRHHAEFDILAQRSITLGEALILKRNHVINDQPALISNQLAADMKEIADITTQENTNWLEIFKVKQSEC